MNKELLISIKPEHLVNILNGQKTLELRKRVPKDYKGWVNIYCTKSPKNILYKYKDVYYTQHYLTFTDYVDVLNRKVVARFWFGEYDTIENEMFLLPDVENIKQLFIEKICEKACLTIKELVDYSNGKTLYTWHIKELEIFDEPKNLSDFYRTDLYATSKGLKKILENNPEDSKAYELKRAPQSYQFVYVKEK